MIKFKFNNVGSDDIAKDMLMNTSRLWGRIPPSNHSSYFGEWITRAPIRALYICQTRSYLVIRVL